MSRWLQRNRGAIEHLLDVGESLVDADRVIAAHRRTVQHVPRVGFVLALTDRRVIAIKASVWLARPRAVITSWDASDGATLATAPLGRVRLVLPDRSVVTLRPYGPRSVRHLGAH